MSRTAWVIQYVADVPPGGRAVIEHADDHAAAAQRAVQVTRQGLGRNVTVWRRGTDGTYTLAGRVNTYLGQPSEPRVLLYDDVRSEQQADDDTAEALRFASARAAREQPPTGRAVVRARRLRIRGVAVLATPRWVLGGWSS